jgi:AraC-like DNA-binding protein
VIKGRVNHAIRHARSTAQAFQVFEIAAMHFKFKETVGASPMEYLTRWRMLWAGDKLVNSSDPISVIALSLDDESESAFSTAFKRVMGCSPRRYGRGRSGASAPASLVEAIAS